MGTVVEIEIEINIIEENKKCKKAKYFDQYL